MKLVKYKTSFVTEKKFPGLIEAKFTHEIKDTKGELKYIGPRIPADVWNQVLSFFKWTYDTTKSECQVRLSVNPVLGRWGAWTLPQKAQTGMTAHEFTLEEIKAEYKRDVIETAEMSKARFDSWGVEPSGDWIYYSTVHHHCNASAFQSGTDEANEKGQDGLHITVGNMDSKRHDLHCRFYLNGAQFEPDMSLFWDIGDDLRERTPESLWDTIARYQMGRPSNVEFPQLWKDNLIEVKRTYGQGSYFRYDGGAGYVSSGTGATVPYSSGTYSPSDNMPDWQKAKFCYECIVRELASDGYSYQEIVDVLNYMGTDDIVENIMTNCNYFKIDFPELYREWPDKSDYLNAMADAIMKQSNVYDLDDDPRMAGSQPSESKSNKPEQPKKHRRNNRENPPPTNTGGGPATAGDDDEMSTLD